IVFECVIGRPAFGSDSIGALVRAICDGALPVPSSIARVPADFDAWFARAAHRDPSQRFASAREMSDALAAMLANAPASGNAGPAARSATAKRRAVELEP